EERPGPVSVPVLLQPAHHAGGRVQPERAPAREDDRVHLGHVVHGVEQGDLAAAGPAAAHVHAGHGTLAREHHGASRGPRREGVVTDLDPLDRGDRPGAARYDGSLNAASEPGSSPLPTGSTMYCTPSCM